MNPKKTNKRKVLIIIGALVLVAGAIAYFVWQASRNAQPAPAASSDNASQEQQSSTKAEQGAQPGEASSQPNKEIPVKEYETVTENEQYTIRREPNSKNYLITLYAVINRPDQYDQYKDQLREYKQNALQYLQNTGVDINSVNIKYEPEEAKDL